MAAPLRSIVVLFLAVAGCGQPPDLEVGLAVYREQYCGTCHAFAFAGTAGMFGPSHDRMRAVAEERLRDPAYAGAATTVEAYLRESLTDPGIYRVPGYERTRFLMPAYTQLSDAQLDALVRLLLDAPSTEGG